MLRSNVKKKEKPEKSYSRKWSKMSQNQDSQKQKKFTNSLFQKWKKGNISWKNMEEIDRIETEVVLKCVQVVDKQASFQKKFEFKKKSDSVWCKAINKGNWNQPDLHEQVFERKTVKVHHICRKCYSKKKEKCKHRKLITVVPLKNDLTRTTWMMQLDKTSYFVIN